MSRPLPLELMPDELDAPFWEGCRRHELLVHRCGACGGSFWPATCCPDHGLERMAWTPASGTGTVHTYTVFHHPYDPRFADRLPYVVAVIRLDEDVFMHADVIDCDPAEVHVDMRVQVVFEDVDERNTIPHFRLLA